MKRTGFMLAVLIFGLAITHVTPVWSDVTEEAIEVAKEWLALVDEESYEECWDEATDSFRGAVPRDEWKQEIEGLRAPLGEFVTRKLQSVQFAVQHSGAQDREYVIIRFESSFSNKENAIETVILMRDEDGSWDISRYIIKK